MEGREKIEMAAAHELKDLLVIHGAVEDDVGQMEMLQICLVAQGVRMVGVRPRADHFGRDNVDLQGEAFGQRPAGQAQGDDSALAGKVVTYEDEPDRFIASKRARSRRYERDSRLQYMGLSEDRVKARPSGIDALETGQGPGGHGDDAEAIRRHELAAQMAAKGLARREHTRQSRLKSDQPVFTQGERYLVHEMSQIERLQGRISRDGQGRAPQAAEIDKADALDRVACLGRNGKVSYVVVGS
jgi:hypothetical protein